MVMLVMLMLKSFVHIHTLLGAKVKILFNTQMLYIHFVLTLIMVLFWPSIIDKSLDHC